MCYGGGCHHQPLSILSCYFTYSKGGFHEKAEQADRSYKDAEGKSILNSLLMDPNVNVSVLLRSSNISYICATFLDCTCGNSHVGWLSHAGTNTNGRTARYEQSVTALPQCAAELGAREAHTKLGSIYQGSSPGSVGAFYGVESDIKKATKRMEQAAILGDARIRFLLASLQMVDGKDEGRAITTEFATIESKRILAIV